jgi:hypothetical protein
MNGMTSILINGKNCLQTMTWSLEVEGNCVSAGYSYFRLGTGNGGYHYARMAVAKTWESPNSNVLPCRPLVTMAYI